MSGVSKDSLENSFFYMYGVPKDIYCYSLENSFSLIELKLFSLRFGPLGLVCLMSESKICHQPSGHRFGHICMKFGTHVYLWHT